MTSDAPDETPRRGTPGFEDPRHVLARHHLVAKRAFSQNFLVSPHVVGQIVSAVGAGAEDVVVELGAGLGTLTGPLLATGAQVVAVDLDRDMLAVLREELAQQNPRLEVVAHDAATVPLSRWATSQRPVLLAGNLPYASTGAILRHVVAERSAIARAVLMMQREVRDRLVAEAGTREYGALTVFVRAAFDVKRVCNVPPGSFHPPPRVSSAVIALVPRSTPVAETDAFRTVVRAAFEQRRKTLRNALGAAAPLGIVDEALSHAGIDGRRRGETLDVTEFARLAACWDDASRRAQ